jgi:glycosyltransferase involved in cell wall biosynthesis
VHVLQIAPCPFPAGRGSQLLIERIARGLIGRGHRVETVAPRRRERGRTETVPTLRASWTRGATAVPVAPQEIRSVPRPQRLLDDALLLIESVRHRPDVIIGHNVEGGWIAGLAGRACGIPAVYARHSDFAEELSLYGPWTRGAALLGSRLETGARRLASRTVSLSPEPGADLIPPPADPDERPIEPADGRTLYYEGNDDPYQNPGWLEVALEAARSRDPRVRLLRGRSPADRPGAADLALVPRSIGGGFPMKLLAYQLAGIPAVCVASGAPGMQDGLDAFVVPGRGSAGAFAERVTLALDDSEARAAVRAAARERALGRNSPEGVAEAWERSLVRAVRASGVSGEARVSVAGP